MLLLSGPNIAGNEWKYIKDCLDTGWVSSVGSYVTKFENMVAEYAGCRFGVATSNGTSALHIALMLAGVKEDDYVLVPNVTFVASLNSIKYTGADPILMDVDRLTWQMDLDLLEEFLENETDEKNDQLFYIKNGRIIRCIMPVHVLGNMINMERLQLLAKKYKLKVIEDTNVNRRWDTGNYDTKSQPERIFWKKIEGLRADWEVESELDISLEK